MNGSPNTYALRLFPTSYGYALLQEKEQRGVNRVDTAFEALLWTSIHCTIIMKTGWSSYCQCFINLYIGYLVQVPNNLKSISAFRYIG